MRWRALKVGKWVAVGMFGLSLVVWVLAANWNLSYQWRDSGNWYGVFIGGGYFGRGIDPSYETGWRLYWEGEQMWFADRTVSWRPAWWLPAIAFPLAAALFIMDRGRVPAGHCRKCGYDLRGTVSDRCSECGTLIERARA